MCGLIGVVGCGSSVFFEDYQYYIDKLKHRGPNGAGKIKINQFSGIHTRLSFQDLSDDANQPMCSLNKRYIILFNGEIYNFKNLKLKYLSDIKFRTNSDTEVIIEGFSKYGNKFFELLEGMFAIVIYDSKLNKLTLVRDSSGMKPLYYCKNDQGFNFSSEISAFKFSKTINIDSKVLFLGLGYVPEPLTIYKNIYQVPASTIMSVDCDCLSYDLTKYKSRNIKESLYDKRCNDTANCIETELRSLLSNSVKDHLTSDSDIAIFLSGGLDSSILSYEASQHKPDITAISLAFEESSLSEIDFQTEIAKYFNIKHQCKVLQNDEVLESSIEFLKSMEQPTIDGLNTYILSKFTKSLGYKGAISGVGADELFFGYPSFRSYKKINKLKSFINLIPLSKLTGKYKKLEYLKLGTVLDSYLAQRCIYSISEISRILSLPSSYILNVFKDFAESFVKNINNDPKYFVQNFELNLYMKNQLLRDSDFFGMQSSLEIRIPFLNNSIIDFSRSFDPALNFGQSNKQLLVNSYRDKIPSSIYTRPKMGFTLPYSSIMKMNESKIRTFEVDNGLNLQSHWSRSWALLVSEKF